MVNAQVCGRSRFKEHFILGVSKQIEIKTARHPKSFTALIKSN